MPWELVRIADGSAKWECGEYQASIGFLAVEAVSRGYRPDAGFGMIWKPNPGDKLTNMKNVCANIMAQDTRAHKCKGDCMIGYQRGLMITDDLDYYEIDENSPAEYQELKRVVDDFDKMFRKMFPGCRIVWRETDIEDVDAWASYNDACHELIGCTDTFMRERTRDSAEMLKEKAFAFFHDYPMECERIATNMITEMSHKNKAAKDDKKE